MTSSQEYELKKGDRLYTITRGTGDLSLHIIVDVTETKAITGSRVRLPRKLSPSKDGSYSIGILPFNTGNRIPTTYFLETPELERRYNRMLQQDVARTLIRQVSNINTTPYTDQQLQTLINQLDSVLNIRP